MKIGLKLINYIFSIVLGHYKDFYFLIHYTTQISSPSKLKIKGGKKTLDSFAKSGNCYFSAYNGIILGKNVLFAPGVKLISSNHDYTLKREPIICESIRIGDNVWLGTGVIVLPGVQIGENSIIGAGSVVSKNIPSNVIAFGIPASIKGYLCVCGSKLKFKENHEYYCEICNTIQVLCSGLKK